MMSAEQTPNTDKSSIKEILFRWSVAVGVVCGPLILLGVSGTVLGIVICIAVLGLGILLFDRVMPSTGAGSVSSWYRVEWNDDRIVLDVTTDTPWRAEIPWVTIRALALEMMDDPLVSDGLHVWVDGREHAFSIPFDAQNGWELVQELLSRELFPNKLMVEAMGSTGETFVHKLREDRGEPHPALVDPTQG